LELEKHAEKLPVVVEDNSAVLYRYNVRGDRGCGDHRSESKRSGRGVVVLRPGRL